ncbi:P-loop containing nucleoside triphosphate hydrolase protein, partial [Mycena amicta]
PPPSKFFQGRKDILLQLDKFFQPTEQKKQTVVLLYGLGGAGKTQIALKFISDSRSRFTDQFKINASSEEAIEMGYKQISLAKNLGDTVEAAQTWLKTNQDEWLLLFDNADKVDLDLGAYLPKCTHGNILITSRNPQLWSHTGPEKKILEISNLVVDDAVVLLLKCAGLNIDKYKTQAVAVVKELYCFPLAIIQAGAFISRIPSLHEDISDFIPLYQKNRAALLSKKPEQSQGDYKLTVYTTWEMSFKQLKPAAAEFLQLYSFIHFEGITEEIFKRASEYIPGDGPLDPSLNILQPALDLLSRFKNSESTWNSLAFGEMMSDICGYSLMVWQSNAYSIHPLVHQWSRIMVDDPVGQRKLVVALLGMSAACSG